MVMLMIMVLTMTDDNGGEIVQFFISKSKDYKTKAYKNEISH